MNKYFLYFYKGRLKIIFKKSFFIKKNNFEILKGNVSIHKNFHICFYLTEIAKVYLVISIFS